MANTTAVYDGLVSLIKGELPTYSQLPNAYDEEENDSLRLTTGFSVGFASGSNTRRQFGCPKVSIARTFNVVFTKLYAANETDTDKRASVEKSLMEDALKVWKKVETTNVLGGVTVNSQYVDDGGITLLNDERSKYISVSSSITIEYQE